MHYLITPAIMCILSNEITTLITKLISKFTRVEFHIAEKITAVHYIGLLMYLSLWPVWARERCRIGLSPGRVS